MLWIGVLIVLNVDDMMVSFEVLRGAYIDEGRPV